MHSHAFFKIQNPVFSARFFSPEVGVVPHFDVGYWLRIARCDGIMTKETSEGEVSPYFLLTCQEEKRRSVSLYRGNQRL